MRTAVLWGFIIAGVSALTLSGCAAPSHVTTAEEFLASYTPPQPTAQCDATCIAERDRAAGALYLRRMENFHSTVNEAPAVYPAPAPAPASSSYRAPVRTVCQPDGNMMVCTTR